MSGTNGLPRVADEELRSVLAPFSESLGGLLGGRLVSIVLYGSITFDDLAPGYGDLDFVAVVEGDLSLEDCERLAALRRPWRRGEHGLLGSMLEGAFLPRAMLDPAQTGRAFWWGTRGERVWDRNQLGWLVLYAIRERGLVIWGEDVRSGIPVVHRQALLEDIERACRNMEEHGRGGGIHAIDWLLTAARELLLLSEGRLCSKSEAAGWAYDHAEGQWREWLPRARQLRLKPSLAELEDWQQWLQDLTTPIQEARRELERALAKQGWPRRG